MAFRVVPKIRRFQPLPVAGLGRMAGLKEHTSAGRIKPKRDLLKRTELRRTKPKGRWKKKYVPKAEREHMGRVAALGCIACLNLGHPGTPAEVHHLKEGNGTSVKASNYRVIPLCPYHHRTGGFGNAYHTNGPEWEKRHGLQVNLLAQTEGLLAGAEAA